MNRFDWAIVVIVAVILVLTGMVIVGILNPNNEFRDKDGHLAMHGKVDGRLLDYLLHGPPVPRETTFVHVDSGRGTMRVILETVPLPSDGTSVSWNFRIVFGRSPSVPELLGIFFEPIRVSVLLVLNAVSGSASGAVCGDGLGPNTCTWTNGAATNLWSTAGNWNGAGGPPQAGDTVIFNATSVANCTVDVTTPALASLTITGTGSIYSGTVTVNLTQTATWGVVAMNAGTTGTLNTAGFTVIMTSMTAAAGTLTLGASLVQVAGTFSKTAGTFNFNTSTVQFTASGNLTLAAGSGASTINSVTIDPTFTATQTVRVGYGGILTINGTLAAGSQSVDITNPSTGGTVSPLVFGGSGVLTGTGTFNWRTTGANETVNVPAATYGTNMTFSWSAQASGVTYSIQGSITTGQWFVSQVTGAGSIVSIVTNGNTIVMNGPLTFNAGSLNQKAGIFFGASTVTGITGLVVNNGGNSFIDWGSSNVTFIGAGNTPWQNGNTMSSQWNAGTSSITFASTLNSFSMTIQPGDSSIYGKCEFYNLTIDSNTAVPQVWRVTGANGMTYRLTVCGTLTIRDSNAGGTEYVDVGNAGSTVGSLIVGAQGTFNAGFSSFILSGNLTIVGTFIASAASQTYLSGTSAQTIAMNGANLGNVLITGTGEKDFTQGFITDSLTAQVTVTMKMTSGVTWTNNGPNISGSAAGIITLVSSASGSAWNFTVPTGETAAYVNVSDSVASHTVTVACDGISQGGTGNSGWVFCPISGGTTLTFGSIDWTLGLFLLAFVILLAFAFLFDEFQGLFLIVSGLAGIMVGFQTYLVTRSVLVSTFFGAIGIIVLMMGVLTTASNVAKRRTGTQ